jgi:hypothetical protein
MLMTYRSRRKHRKIATGFLNPNALHEHTHVLDHEAVVLIQELYRDGKAGADPINPQSHAGRCSLNNMLTIVFGIRTDTVHHPLVGKALRLSREFMSVFWLRAQSLPLRIDTIFSGIVLVLYRILRTSYRSFSGFLIL